MLETRHFSRQGLPLSVEKCFFFYQRCWKMLNFGNAIFSKTKTPTEHWKTLNVGNMVYSNTILPKIKLRDELYNFVLKKHIPNQYKSDYTWSKRILHTLLDYCVKPEIRLDHILSIWLSLNCLILYQFE